LKVFHVDVGTAPKEVVRHLHEVMEDYQQAGHLAILDRGGKGAPGGKGLTFDWSIARELARLGHRFFLAGGLTLENVSTAIRGVRPWGVDVSSGVETNGVQDTTKIEAFIRNAREAGKEANVNQNRTSR
jgi:phosphoribosylanthranilate isomerase